MRSQFVLILLCLFTIPLNSQSLFDYEDHYHDLNYHNYPHPDSHQHRQHDRHFQNEELDHHQNLNHHHDEDDDHESGNDHSTSESSVQFLSSDDFARAQHPERFSIDVNELSYDPETTNDFGYYEGDMMIKQREEEMVAKYTARRWPHGKIPYAMEKGKFSPDERAAIARGMMRLQDRTCIKFVPKKKTDKDYVLMKRGPGCAAHVGRIGGQQLLFLGRGCFGIETVVHELMHSVGFIHEQSRPDRDAHVNIMWDNIKEAQKRNFRKHSNDYLADHGFPYDLMSAMHYRTHAFSKNNKPTIVAKRPVPYLRCRGDGCPSDLDVRKINYLYKCNGKTSGFKGKSSLDTFGVNDIEDEQPGKPIGRFIGREPKNIGVVFKGNENRRPKFTDDYQEGGFDDDGFYQSHRGAGFGPRGPAGPGLEGPFSNNPIGLFDYPDHQLQHQQQLSQHYNVPHHHDPNYHDLHHDEPNHHQPTISITMDHSQQQPADPGWLGYLRNVFWA